MNTFEVAVEQGEKVDHRSFNARKEQCAPVSSMYDVFYENAIPRQAGLPVTGVHWMVHCCPTSHSKAHNSSRTGLIPIFSVYLSYNVVQFSIYCSNPLLLILQPIQTVGVNVTLGHLPIKAYEPTIEIRDRAPRSVYIEARRELQLTRRPVGAKVAQAVRSLHHLSAFLYTVFPSRIPSSNATSCRQNAIRPNPGPCELCQRRPLRCVMSSHALLLSYPTFRLHTKRSRYNTVPGRFDSFAPSKRQSGFQG